MWRADAALECFLVLGAAHLEWGVGRRQGAAMVWQSRRRLAFADGESFLSVRVALHDLSDTLRESPSQTSPDDPGLTEGAALRVLVSERWMSLTDFPWHPQLADTPNADSYLRHALVDSGHSLAPGDRLTFDAPDWGERVSVAMWPEGLCQTLEEFAATLRLRFVGLLPLPLAVCAPPSREAAGPVAIAIVEPGWMRCYAAMNEVPACLRPLGERIPVDAEADIAAHCARLPLRWPGLQLPVRAVFLGTDLPFSFHERLVGVNAPSGEWPLLNQAEHAWPGLAGHGLDAAPALPAPTQRQWMVLGGLVGLLSLVVTLLVIVLVRAPADRSSRPVAEIAPVALQTVDPRRQAAVAGAVEMLNLPLDALMRQLVPPQDIRALPIDLEMGREASVRDGPAGVTMKLLVESPTAEEMSRYVAFLADRPQIARIQLLRHEVVEAEAARPYRYHLELRWKD
ncbi:hypothetical protein [Rhodocyclus tenuis]|uniref:Uncharacterized protein n=1 Tax=Rhodocyclus tenuis TaxID=1066 RepID=A0A840G3Z2_RHOTE|nr:hypothetical protein [Rhodocyclus tenuis]MBB4249144.1 hypothetical protein [Rhodocyclus tenuis]